MNWLPFMPGLILAVLAVWWGLNRAADRKAHERQIAKMIKDQAETAERMRNADIVGDDPAASKRWLSERAKQ